MRTHTIKGLAAAAVLVAVGLAFEQPASGHHSFAMYDQTKVVAFTGVVRQFVPQANHAEIHFYVMAADRKGLEKKADGKYLQWGVELAGTAQLARQGITPATFGEGTVFSIRLNPLRDGSNFGARAGALVKCPIDAATKKPVLPAAGMHCDSVPGHTVVGGQNF